MAKIHVSPDDLVPRRCTAQEGNCEYQIPDSEHGSTKKEAMEKYTARIDSLRAQLPKFAPSTPYPDDFNEEVMDSIPLAADGSTYSENWDWVNERARGNKSQTRDRFVNQYPVSLDVVDVRIAEVVIDGNEVRELEESERGTGKGQKVVAVEGMNGNRYSACHCSDEDVNNAANDGYTCCNGSLTEATRYYGNYSKHLNHVGFTIVDKDDAVDYFEFYEEERYAELEALKADEAKIREAQAKLYSATSKWSPNKLVVMPLNPDIAALHENAAAELHRRDDETAIDHWKSKEEREQARLEVMELRIAQHWPGKPNTVPESLRYNYKR